MKLTVNPEWLDAPYGIKFADELGHFLTFNEGPRFKAANLDEAIEAMKRHDHATINRLAIRKYIEQACNDGSAGVIEPE